MLNVRRYSVCEYWAAPTVNHCKVRPSRLTSRVIVANSTLTDIPHIKTPMMLSNGPSMCQFDGRTMSP